MKRRRKVPRDGTEVEPSTLPSYPRSSTVPVRSSATMSGASDDAFSAFLPPLPAPLADTSSRNLSSVSPPDPFALFGSGFEDGVFSGFGGESGDSQLEAAGESEGDELAPLGPPGSETEC